MATYTDSFNRANGPLGSNWTTLSWADSAPTIDTNEVVYGGTGVSVAFWDGGGTWGRHQKSEITVGSFTTDPIGLVVYASDANGAYLVRFSPDISAYNIRKVDNTGTETQLGVGESAPTTSTTGDTISLEAEDDGSGNTLLTVYYNDVEQTTRTDSSSPITSGNPGIYARQYGRSAIDAWEGDDFAAAATATVTAIVTDQSGTALNNETGVSWHWTDSFSGNPTDSGSSETTDGSGQIVVDVPNSNLSSGQFGYLTVKLSNGNVGIAREAID